MYGLPAPGTAETVGRLDAARAREFHGRVFLPNNAIFFASGAVSMSELMPRIERAFGAWQPGEVPEPGPAPAAFRWFYVIVVGREGEPVPPPTGTALA